MRKREGDLFAQFVGDADVALVIPTAGTLDKLNYAAMTTPVARRASQTWPEMKRQLGKLIDTCGNHCFVVPVTRQMREWTVSFPIAPKNLKLMERSAHELAGLADAYQWDRVFLPQVGTELGLHWTRDVRPILKDILDDRFTVVYSVKEDNVKKAPVKRRKPVSKRM